MSLDPHEKPTAIQTHISAIFISLELSRSKWLITSLAPGGGQRMSRHSVAAGDLAGLLARFWAIREKASNLLHLSRRKAVSFANLKTFVPDLPLGCDSLLRRHRFLPCPCNRPLLSLSWSRPYGNQQAPTQRPHRTFGPTVSPTSVATMQRLGRYRRKRRHCSDTVHV